VIEEARRRQRRRRGRGATAATAALAAIVAASVGGGGKSNPAPGSPAPARPPLNTAPISQVQPPPRGTQSVSVGCASAVFSPGQTWPNHWPRPYANTIVAGPLAWPGLRYVATDSGLPGGAPPPASYAPQQGFATAVKALVAVDDGGVVRVSIPATERGRLSLDYTYIQPRNPNRPDPYRVADGAREVTFRACAPGSNDAPSTLYAGGFIVAGAQCARIDIYASVSDPPLRRQIPFGVPGSSCPAIG